jgi:hypothetical protein
MISVDDAPMHGYSNDNTRLPAVGLFVKTWSAASDTHRLAITPEQHLQNKLRSQHHRAQTLAYLGGLLAFPGSSAMS